MAWPANAKAYQRIMPGATTQQIVDRFAPAPTVRRVAAETAKLSVFNRSLFAHALVLLWPALSLATLMIFQISMRKARIRPVHFARCVVYSADVILWANLLLAAAVIAFTLRQMLVGGTVIRLPEHLENYGIAAVCLFAAALLVFVYRLIVALKHYVHFDHPVGTIFASQFIVFLIVLIIVTMPMHF